MMGSGWIAMELSPQHGIQRSQCCCLTMSVSIRSRAAYPLVVFWLSTLFNDFIPPDGVVACAVVSWSARLGGGGDGGRMPWGDDLDDVDAVDAIEGEVVQTWDSHGSDSSYCL